MLGDLGGRIPVLDRVKDAVCPLLSAPAGGFAKDMLHEGLLRKAVGVRSRVLAPCLLLCVEVDDSTGGEPYNTIQYVGAKTKTPPWD